MPWSTSSILYRYFPQGRRAVLLWGVCLVIAISQSQPAAAYEVHFPGPVPVEILSTPMSALAVPWESETGQYLVVGTDNGFLNLVRLLSGSMTFNVYDRHFLDGQVTGLETWESMDPDFNGIVVATTNPDRIVFFQLQPTAPFFVARHEVGLPEDPGSLAFVGPAFPGGQELAVSLPGIDQIVVLQEENGSWVIGQELASGDGPQSLVGLDLELDGIREIVSADSGVLSRSLGIFRRDPEGVYARSGQQSLSGWPRVVESYDIDGDNQDELVVGFSNQAELLFMEADSGQLSPMDSLALTLPADSLHLCPLPEGQVGLFTSVQDRGLVEFFSHEGGQWTTQESYYPGCRPSSITTGDFNLDGLQDLVSLGSEALPSTVMFGTPEPGLWGFPALTLNAAPGSSCLADFDLDGHPDLVVSGSEESLLSIFLGRGDGGLAAVPVDQQLSYLAGGMVAVEAGGSEGPELALLDLFNGQLRILDYTSAGGFQLLTSRSVLPFPQQLHASDLDRDGKEDLFMTRRSVPDILVLYGDGEGQFDDQTAVVLATGAEEAAVVDLNGDTFPDLIGTDGLNRVYTVLNQQDRTFTIGSWVTAGTGARFLATGDLDGDLDLDVVVGNRTEQSLTFLENASNGALVRRIGAHALSGTPQGIQCSDLDLNESTDVLINFGDEGNIGVVFGLGDWSYGSTLRYPGGININRTMANDFNLDGYPDVLNLDQSLRLGLTMLNLDTGLVAVDPSALAIECHEGGLTVAIVPDRSGPWDLELGAQDSWLSLVQAGQSVVGRLDFDGRRWVLDLDWPDVAFYLDQGGTPATFRLGVGVGADREYLTLGVDPECGPANPSRVPALLDWVQDPWPNPFNPQIQSRVNLRRPATISAGIFDLSGRRVATLWEGELSAGTHTLAWDGTSSGRPNSAGVYFLRITGPGTVLSRKILLLK